MKKGFIISVIIFVILVTHCHGQPGTNAGPDQVTYQPFNTLTLDGSGTSGDPVITYLWEKMSGPVEGAITSSTSAITTVTNLAVGTYIFRLTATNGGGPAIDAMQIIVHRQKSPDCNAAAKQRFSLNPYVIGGNEIYQPNLTTTFPTLNGGDSVIIPENYYSSNIVLGGFTGDSCNPIVIIDSGNVRFTYLRILSGRFFKLTGTGWPGNTYGLYGSTASDGSGAAAIQIDGLSSDYTVEYVDAYNVENGVFNRPNVDTLDCRTYWPNWDMGTVEYRYMRIRKTGGEGMYVGHSFTPWPCDIELYSHGSYHQPIPFKNLWIHHVTCDSLGWDGIQVSNIQDSTIIENNLVTNYGLNNFGAQKIGIILGGFARGRVNNNTVRVGTGVGIADFGFGVNRIYYNTLDSCGMMQSNLEPSIYTSDNLVSCLPAKDSLQVFITDNCIQHVSAYTGAAAIRNNNFNSTTKAGVISGNTIGDPLGRPLYSWPTNSLIYTGAADVVTANVLSTSCLQPWNPVIRRRIIIKF